jgi:hypothetical protein
MPKVEVEQLKQWQAAQKEYQDALAQEIGSRENIVIDGTAASYKKTESLKNTLEAAGYDVMMVFVYSSLEKSLKKNEDRFERSAGEDRSLMPGIVMQTWANVTKNFIPYLNLFGQNFVATTKDKDPFSKKSLEDIVKRYIEPYTPTDTKEKQKKNRLDLELKKKNLNKKLYHYATRKTFKTLLQQTVSIPEAQSKIKQFLNS